MIPVPIPRPRAHSRSTQAIRPSASRTPTPLPDRGWWGVPRVWLLPAAPGSTIPTRGSRLGSRTHQWSPGCSPTPRRSSRTRAWSGLGGAPRARPGAGGAGSAKRGPPLRGVWVAPVALDRTAFPSTGGVVNSAAAVRLDRPEGLRRTSAPSPVGAGGLDPPPRASLGFGRTTWSRTLGDGVGPRWSRIPTDPPWGTGHSLRAVRDGGGGVATHPRAVPVGAGRPGSATAAGRSLLTVRNGGGGVAA